MITVNILNIFLQIYFIESVKNIYFDEDINLASDWCASIQSTVYYNTDFV